MMTGVLLRLGLYFTGDRFSLLQKLRYTFGVPFVRLVTERVTQLVADCKIKEALPVHVPLQQQFGAAHWYLRHQRIIEERLAFRIIRKRWAVWIKAPGAQNGLPVLGTHQYPSPVSELRYWIVGQGLFQDQHLVVALSLAIASVTHELLRRSWQVRLASGPRLRGERGDHRRENLVLRP